MPAPAAPRTNQPRAYGSPAGNRLDRKMPSDAANSCSAPISPDAAPAVVRNVVTPALIDSGSRKPLP